jgi:hypothetical protein
MLIHNLQITKKRQRRVQRKSTSPSTVVPLLRENVYLLKGSSGAQLDRVTRGMFTVAAGLCLSRWLGISSLRLYVFLVRE